MSQRRKKAHKIQESGTLGLCQSDEGVFDMIGESRGMGVVDWAGLQRILEGGSWRDISRACQLF